MNAWAQNKKGFTIVELLIVIVVIAILAVITIVAFNGIQNRAAFGKVQSELVSIKKGLMLYHADNGNYPITGTTSAPGWRYSCSAGTTNFITAINTYMTVPQAPCSAGATNNDTWIYASDGVGYKLMHIRPVSTLASVVPTELRDFRYTASQPTWGYWTSDWASI